MTDINKAEKEFFETFAPQVAKHSKFLLDQINKHLIKYKDLNPYVHASIVGTLVENLSDLHNQLLEIIEQHGGTPKMAFYGMDKDGGFVFK